MVNGCGECQPFGTSLLTHINRPTQPAGHSGDAGALGITASLISQARS
ncbi:hypothetical protein BIFGAL_03856 [Bifidobacterium gallicum DSM 20093 = LMG 11596]|uniref:Uncharacterized protein n=1 Tax=Bifidobacterium gallicum DSM 20093 = LMG 11596 TaxID=561180 RepID=D1NVG7_9BIFI|nr:hypothetical protein BIFGAL_03856 [Bifidobacterium gallicum DSM 20093 = LMG 11596]